MSVLTADLSNFGWGYSLVQLVRKKYSEFYDRVFKYPLIMGIAAVQFMVVVYDLERITLK